MADEVPTTGGTFLGDRADQEGAGKETIQTDNEALISMGQDHLRRWSAAADASVALGEIEKVSDHSRR